MDGSFDPTIAGFTPREGPAAQAPITSNPWSSDYRMNHGPPSNGSFPARSEFSSPAPSSFRSPAPSSFNPQSASLNPAGYHVPNTSGSNVMPGGLHAGSFNGILTPSLTSVGLSGVGGLASRGMGSRVHSANLTLSTSALNTASPTADRGDRGDHGDHGDHRGRGDLGLGLSPSVPSSGLNSSSSNFATSNSAASTSATSKSGWQHSAFSPGSGLAADAMLSRPKDQIAGPPSGSSPAGQRRHGASSVPGLLPNESMNDTFVMEMDDSPEEIISELKLQVESLITAIVMSKSQSSGVAASSTLQGADGVEVAHRIMNRLKALRRENEYLGKLTSGEHAAELEARTQVLEQENALLKRQLREMQCESERAER